MVKIEKEILQDGTVRWRARGVSAGKWPNGRRRQVTITGRTKKEVQAEVARITGALAAGTYVHKWDGTVADLCADYVKSAAFERSANTQVSYRNSLKPAIERLGHRKARTIEMADVEALRDWMLAEGRRRGGKPGTPLGAESVRKTISRLSAAFVHAIRAKRLEANPCLYVRLPAVQQRDDTTWSEGQLRAFLAVAGTDRLAACWLMSALGLRRGEICGLKWSDVSFTDGTVTIGRARVQVEGKVIEKDPKSRRSRRVLPLFEPVTGALEALYKAQAAEKAAAGAAWPGDVDGGYIAADELGAPLKPRRYSDEFAQLCREAGLPKIRLHDTRGTMNSILEQAGVPDSLRACWLGHTVAVNRGVYLPQPKELTAVSDAISRILTAPVSKM
jgi:integrase